MTNGWYAAQERNFIELMTLGRKLKASYGVGPYT